MLETAGTPSSTGTILVGRNVRTRNPLVLTRGGCQFTDNGIRNAIIENFDPISTREDKGALWENFFYVERIKEHSLNHDFGRVYFWRTAGRSPKEIDFVEVVEGKMQAFECKLNPEAKIHGAAAFSKAYPDCPIRIASPATLPLVLKQAKAYLSAASSGI
ncbi:MAG TPA: DUF4143 domain-containing protein [Candidatus Aphodousia gallistercoris]|nr:DUF4143 domain-containing protein [Candidatus Aphodousia gallistercoris]